MYCHVNCYKPVKFAGEVGVVLSQMFLLGQCLLQLPLQLADLVLHLTALHV